MSRVVCNMRFVVQEAVVEVLPTEKKFRNLRTNGEKNGRRVEIQFSPINLRENSFEETKMAVNKNLPAAREDTMALESKLVEVFSKLNMLKTNFGQSRKFCVLMDHRGLLHDFKSVPDRSCPKSFAKFIRVYL